MKIDCCLVRDLLPLYVEKLVSEKTALLIEEHLNGCAECQKELKIVSTESFKNVESENINDAVPLKKVARKFSFQMQSMAYALIILFVFLGLTITEGSDMMYNSLIMPVIGVFGYCAFRLKSLYKLPVLMLFIEAFAYTFKLINAEPYSLLIWSLIYLLFVYIGLAVAYLFHYAFRKE